jgi:hypothetical protein
LPVPLPEFPTLREFIDKAVTFGAEVKYISDIMEGPAGPVRFEYLWINSERFVEIPNLPTDTRIPPDTIDRLARRLKIPAKDFWPPIEAFGWDKDDETDPPVDPDSN